MGETEDMTSELESEDVPVVVEDAPEVTAVPEAEDVPDELALLAADLDSEEVAATDPAIVTPSLVEEAPPAEIAPEEDTSESFDTIAPAVVPKSSDELTVVGATSDGGTVPWWPFLTYLGAWLVLSALAVWQLMLAPASQATYESAIYGAMILGGVVMTAVGPVLILAVWLAVRSGRAPGERSGLLTSSLLKGALVTLSGAIVWWAAILIVDYLRLGTPL